MTVFEMPHRAIPISTLLPSLCLEVLKKKTDLVLCLVQVPLHSHCVCTLCRLRGERLLSTTTTSIDMGRYQVGPSVLSLRDVGNIACLCRSWEKVKKDVGQKEQTWKWREGREVQFVTLSMGHLSKRTNKKPQQFWGDTQSHIFDA